MTLRFNESAHAARGGGGGMTPSDDGDEGSLDPSLIEIGAAVYVAYAFGKVD